MENALVSDFCDYLAGELEESRRIEKVTARAAQLEAATVDAVATLSGETVGARLVTELAEHFGVPVKTLRDAIAHPLASLQLRRADAKAAVEAGL